MIIPREDRVLVRPASISLSKTILVNNTDKYNLGEVVAIGPGKRDKRGIRQTLDVQIGDKIRYGNGTYLDWPIIKDGNESYQLIQEGDVVGIVQPEQPKKRPRLYRDAGSIITIGELYAAEAIKERESL